MTFQRTLLLIAVCTGALSACAGRGVAPAPIEDRAYQPTAAKPVAKPQVKPLPPPRDPSLPVVNALPDADSPLLRATPLGAPVPISAPASASSPDPAAAIARPAGVSKILDEAAAAAKSGQHAAARAKLERAVELSPRDAEVWFRLAQISATEGDWSQARSLADRAHSLAAMGSPLSEESGALSKKADAALSAAGGPAGH
jgi:hypothetical protein